MIEWRRMSHALIVLAAALAVATVAAAQTAATGAPPAAPAVAPPPAWHGSLSFALSSASGVQAQRSIQLQGNLVRPFSHGGRFSIKGEQDYQRVTFPSDTPLADRTSLGVGEDEHPTPRTVVIVRSLYLRDSQLQIDSRFEQLAGYGLQLHHKSKRTLELQLVPGLSIYKEDLAYADPAGWEPAWGFFEKFSATLNEAWSIENSFRFRHDFSDAKRSIESSAAVEGKILKAVAIQLQYQYNYESIVPADFPNYLSMFGVGLKFKF